MAINFTFVGKLMLGKDTDKKQAYTEKEHYLETSNGDKIVKGHSRKLNLIVRCGEDVFFPTVGGYMGNVIYSLSKSDNKSLQFPSSKRNDYLDKIAHFKKYVFTDDTNKIKHEFTTEYDLALCVHEMLSTDEYKDKVFRVTGEVEYSTYTKDGVENVYKNYKITNLCTVSDDALQQAVLTTDLFLTEDYFDESRVESDSIVTLLGYVPVYDGNKKKLCGDGTRGFFEKYEFDLSHEEEVRDNQIKALRKKFEPNTSNGEGFLSKTGIHVKLINRTDEIDFDESMLSEDEILDIELGITTFEDIKAFHSGGKSNNYTRREVLCGFKPSFLGGTQASTYTLESLVSDGTKKEELFVDFGEDMTGIFDDEMPFA